MEKRVIDRKDRAARIAEQVVDALILQGLHHHFGAGHRLRHLSAPDFMRFSFGTVSFGTLRAIKKAPFGTRISAIGRKSGSVPACCWRLLLQECSARGIFPERESAFIGQRLGRVKPRPSARNAKISLPSRRNRAAQAARSRRRLENGADASSTMTRALGRQPAAARQRRQRRFGKAAIDRADRERPAYRAGRAARRPACARRGGKCASPRQARASRYFRGSAPAPARRHRRRGRIPRRAKPPPVQRRPFPRTGRSLFRRAADRHRNGREY